MARVPQVRNIYRCVITWLAYRHTV